MEHLSPRQLPYCTPLEYPQSGPVSDRQGPGSCRCLALTDGYYRRFPVFDGDVLDHQAANLVEPCPGIEAQDEQITNARVDLPPSAAIGAMEESYQLGLGEGSLLLRTPAAAWSLPDYLLGDPMASPRVTA